MKNYDLNKEIDQLEKQIQFLLNDHKALLKQHNTLFDLKGLRMQIKQAEESLRLKKRMRYIFPN